MAGEYRHVPRLAFVNKMTVPRDFFRVVQMMTDRLKANPVPIVIPVGAKSTYRWWIHQMRAILWTIATVGMTFSYAPVRDDLGNRPTVAGKEKWFPAARSQRRTDVIKYL